MSQTFSNHMGRDVLRTVYIITSVIQCLGGYLAHDPCVHVQDLWPHQVLPDGRGMLNISNRSEVHMPVE